MIDGSLFDFVNTNFVKLIEFPNCILEKELFVSKLYVAFSDFVECESGDLSFSKRKFNLFFFLIN